MGTRLFKKQVSQEAPAWLTDQQLPRRPGLLEGLFTKQAACRKTL